MMHAGIDVYPYDMMRLIDNQLHVWVYSELVDTWASYPYIESLLISYVGIVINLLRPIRYDVLTTSYPQTHPSPHLIAMHAIITR